MVIVNTTFVMHPDVSNDVLAWIKSAYLASAIYCGAFAEHTFIAKILADISPDTISYAVHVGFEDKESAQKWCEGVGASLRRKLSERWGERAVAFHTYLEQVEI